MGGSPPPPMNKTLTPAGCPPILQPSSVLPVSRDGIRFHGSRVPSYKSASHPHPTWYLVILTHWLKTRGSEDPLPHFLICYRSSQNSEIHSLTRSLVYHKKDTTQEQPNGVMHRPNVGKRHRVSICLLTKLSKASPFGFHGSFLTQTCLIKSPVIDSTPSPP